jgi:hypothetical protein
LVVYTPSRGEIWRQEAMDAAAREDFRRRHRGVTAVGG